MRRSRIEVYLHFVWATHLRQPLISADIKRPLYRCIASQVTEVAGSVLAIGGIENHVHLLVGMPSTVAIARLMNQVKGVSSHFVRESFPDHDGFAWQENYAVFSVGINQIHAVVEYINGQEAHHREGILHNRWEETDEAGPTGP